MCVHVLTVYGFFLCQWLHSHGKVYNTRPFIYNVLDGEGGVKALFLLLEFLDSLYYPLRMAPEEVAL